MGLRTGPLCRGCVAYAIWLTGCRGLQACAPPVLTAAPRRRRAQEAATNKLAPNLIIMASAALLMANLNTASVMGSVTLSVLKRLAHVPVAVVTANSKNLQLTQRRE
jgi:hypothetical protein